MKALALLILLVLPISCTMEVKIVEWVEPEEPEIEWGCDTVLLYDSVWVGYPAKVSAPYPWKYINFRDSITCYTYEISYDRWTK